jgi:hypothetical protein
MASLTKAEAQAILDADDAVSPDEVTAPRTAVPEPEDDTPWYESAYDSAYEYVTGSKADKTLEEKYGPQVTGGAPAFVRADVGAVTSHRDKTIRAMNLLGAMQGTEFKLDPDTKRLLYKKTGSDGFIAMDPPGFEMGEIPEILGSDAATLVGEGIGVGLTRGKGKGFWPKAKRAMFGIFGGAAAGEAAKEYANIERGAYDHLKDPNTGELPTGTLLDKLTAEPGKAGALTLAGAGAVRSLGGAYKGAKGYLTGKNIPGSFVERGLALPKEAPEVIAQLNAFLRDSGSDKVFKPDSARALNDPELMAALDAYARERGPEGRNAVQALYRANQEAIEEGVKAAGAKEVAGSATALETEAALSRALEGSAREAESAMSGRVGQAGREAEQAALDVESRAGLDARDPQLGQQVKDVPEEEVSQLQKWADATYGPIVKAASKTRFHNENLYKAAKTQKELYDLDLSPKLSQENRALATDIKETLDGIRNQQAKAGVKNPFTSSFEQHRRLVSQLKSFERKLDEGMLPELDKSAIADLRIAAMKDRTEWLLKHDAKNGTDLHKQLLEADDIYKKKKDQHAGGVLKELLTVSPRKRRPRVSNFEAFSKIFGKDGAGSEQRAADFAEVLVENGTKYLNEFQAVKAGIFRKFFDDVSSGGVVDAKKATRWIDEHQGNLNTYLNPDEMTVLRNATNAAEVVAIGDARQAAFEKALRGSAVGKITKKAQASTYFEELWKNPQTIEQARRILSKSHPVEWQMFKAQALNQVKADLKSKTPRELFDVMGGKDTITYEGLKTVLSGKYRTKIKALFGDEYVKNLDMLRQAAAVLGRKPGKTNVDQQNKWVELIRNVAFGPLSHRNFAIKKLGLARIGVQLDNLEEMVLDPDLLNQAARAMHTPEGMKTFQTLLGSGVALKATEPQDTPNLHTDKGIQKLRDDIRGNPRLQHKIQRTIVTQ